MQMVTVLYRYRVNQYWKFVRLVIFRTLVITSCRFDFGITSQIFTKQFSVIRHTYYYLSSYLQSVWGIFY